MKNTTQIIQNKQLQKCIENKSAFKISLINIILNFLLFIIKYLAGTFGNSDSMKADAIHSLSDVFISIIVFIGIKISNKSSDHKFPYGYDRIECISAIILSFILFDVGLLIGLNSIKDLINNNNLTTSQPKIFALVINILSIIIKLLMFFITKIISTKTNYSALKAEAWHHLSDILSSVGVFIGLLFSLFGVYFADKIASIIICLIILKVAIEVFIDSVKKIIDYCAPKEIIIKIQNIINDFISNNNYYLISKIDASKIKTRIFGNYIYVNIYLQLNINIKINKYLQISNQLKNEILEKIPEIKNCNIII